jgi:hypothetical protein
MSYKSSCFCYAIEVQNTGLDTFCSGRHELDLDVVTSRRRSGMIQ